MDRSQWRWNNPRGMSGHSASVKTVAFDRNPLTGGRNVEIWRPTIPAPSPVISPFPLKSLHSHHVCSIRLGTNAECRFCVELELGPLIFPRKRLECSVQGTYVGNFDFDEMDATWFTNGHSLAGGRIEFRTAPQELRAVANFGIP
jgi:hypothetical protein